MASQANPVKDAVARAAFATLQGDVYLKANASFRMNSRQVDPHRLYVMVTVSDGSVRTFEVRVREVR